MYRLPGVFMLILLFASGISGRAGAQSTGKVKYLPTAGTLTGEVSDQHGMPLAGTSVTVTNVDKQLSQTTATGAQGVFRVNALVPGEYEVSYEAKSFTPVKQKAKIKAGKTTKVHARLKYIEPQS